MAPNGRGEVEIARSAYRSEGFHPAEAPSGWKVYVFGVRCIIGVSERKNRGEAFMVVSSVGQVGGTP